MDPARLGADGHGFAAPIRVSPAPLALSRMPAPASRESNA
jgi:hypothetical protein